MSDIELLRRIEQQDQQALAQLYDRYAKPVYSLTYRVLQNTVLAEEATQDTFLKVWRQAARWDARKGEFLSWLLTVARYTAIDRLRHERKQWIAHGELHDEQIAEDELPFRDGQLLRELMRRLPPEQAECIEMAFFEGFTHSQLAQQLNLPLGTVKARIRMGLQKLKTQWQNAHRQLTD
ncbi:MAG: sigma-70 family RNA polymerase sigma factor [Anaerolineae bacterium]|jgi:RNA polymerase sigma-70 factor (ECF subfamily)|nr:sigma-70 family RNA polymerase sigma factor [Anaerolineae bacterium]